MNTKDKPAPPLAAIVIPCIIGTFMTAVSLYDYAIMISGDKTLITSFYKNKPLFIIGSIIKYIPFLLLLVLIKLIFVDLVNLVKCKATLSTYWGFLIVAILGAIIYNAIPMEQIEKKIINETANDKDMNDAVNYLLAILIGNIVGLIHGIGGYIIETKEAKQQDSKSKKKLL
eukprot:337307_1